MIKYLKNITSTSFNVAGFEIGPSEIKELPYLKQTKFFNSENMSVEDLINEDKVLLSIDGSTTLSKELSLEVIKHISEAKENYFQNKDIRSNDISAKNTQEAIEEVLSNPNLLVNGKLIQAEFSYHGTAKNRWLRMNYSVGSDITPFIVPFNCRLVAITMSNDAYADTDIEIHNMKRGSEVTTFQYLYSVRDSRSALKNISKDDPDNHFEYGDKIGIYVRDRGSNLKKPNIVLYFVVSSKGSDHTEQFYNDLERGWSNGSFEEWDD